MRSKYFLVVLIIFCFSFSQPYKRPTVNYYHLRFYKHAKAPHVVNMHKIDNVSHSRAVISEGVLFTYKNRRARSVYIAGNFSLWQPRKMERSKYGVWYYYLTGFHKTIKYKYQVDSIWIHDTLNDEKADDGIGAYVSLAHPPRNSEGTQISYRIIGTHLVEFRIYKPKAQFVSIVGDFNNWNPEHDLLKKDKNGIWRLKKRIMPGTYRYKYIIDGKWQTDLYNNKTAYGRNGSISSVIELK